MTSSSAPTAGPASSQASRTVVVGHHTPDVYGSDLQLLESVTGLVDAGYRVVVAVPGEGPLLALLRERGAEIVPVGVPALRKSSLTPVGLIRLALAMALALPRAVRVLRRERASAVYVNTLIVPLWLVAARLARVPALCHVHEAHDTGPRLLRAALAAPLLLADGVVVNSQASTRAIRDALPRAAARARIVYNGVAGPDTVGDLAALPAAPVRLGVVGRLSPRKGTDVALEAAALLVARGHDVEIEVAGSVFEGYEWFEAELRERAERPDLRGRVVFHGYLNPVWDLLARCHVALVPSRAEPFGNAAVEAQLAGRPVVVSGVQGLVEIVTDGETGLVAPPEDAAALADRIERLLANPELAAEIAAAGRSSAERRFTPPAYRGQIVAEVAAVAG